MYPRRTILGFAVWTIFILTLRISTAFKLKMRNAVCETYNKSLVEIEECRLRAVNRNKTTLTMLANVKEPLNDIFVRMKMLKRENGYKPWLMDYTFDLCKMMRKAHHPAGKMILNILNGTSTWTHPCPFVGVNGIRNFYRVDHLPIIFPTSEYLICFSWITKKKIFCLTNIYFTFLEDY